MYTKDLELKMASLNDLIDKLILIKLCKLKVKRGLVQDILGSLENNTFLKINKIFSN